MNAFRWTLVIFAALLALAVLSGRVESAWSLVVAGGAGLAWLGSLFQRRAVTPRQATEAIERREREVVAEADARFVREVEAAEAEHAAETKRPAVDRAQERIDAQRRGKP